MIFYQVCRMLFSRPALLGLIFLLASELGASGSSRDTLSEDPATERSREEAAALASRCLAVAVPVDRGQLRTEADCGKESETGEGFYFFKGENGRGFAIISRDRRLSPITAYSSSGQFDPRRLPPACIALLSAYAVCRKGQESGEQFPSVAPLLDDICWGQGHPYNYYSPTAESDGGEEKTVAGCVATAMAQIMRLHQYPEQGKGVIKYLWRKRLISADFGAATYDWGLMPSNPKIVDCSRAQINAIGTLVFHCGVSTFMNWGTAEEGGSGAYSRNVAKALVRNFKYDAGLRLFNRMMFDYPQWHRMILQELTAGRPVYYSGRSVSGGHAFVCDGYDAGTGLFHINWGWDGMADGYYDLRSLEPSMQGTGGGIGAFSYDQEAIFGIKPAEGNSEDAPQSGTAVLYGSVEVSRYEAYLGDSIAIHYPAIVNLGLEDMTNLSFWGVLCDTVGNPYDTLFIRPAPDIPVQSYYTMTAKLRIPPMLSEGRYTLKTYYVDAGSRAFCPIYPYRGDCATVEFVVAAGRRVSILVADANARLTVFRNPVPIRTLMPYDSCAVAVGIRNVGKGEFLSLVALEACPEGETVFSRVIESRLCLSAGSDTLFVVGSEELPLKPGHYTFRLTYDAQNKEQYEQSRRPFAPLGPSFIGEVLFSEKGFPILSASEVQLPRSIDFQTSERMSVLVQNEGGVYKGDIRPCVFRRDYRGLQVYRFLPVVQVDIPARGSCQSDFLIDPVASDLELGAEYTLGLTYERKNKRRLIPGLLHTFSIVDNRPIILGGKPLITLVEGDRSLIRFDVVNNDDSGRSYAGEVRLVIRDECGRDLHTLNQALTLSPYMFETVKFEQRFAGIRAGNKYGISAEFRHENDLTTQVHPLFSEDEVPARFPLSSPEVAADRKWCSADFPIVLFDLQGRCVARISSSEELSARKALLSFPEGTLLLIYSRRGSPLGRLIL